MAKVKLTGRTTIEVEIYTGVVKCEKCGHHNLVTTPDKDDISINCEECSAEIGCEWQAGISGFGQLIIPDVVFSEERAEVCKCGSNLFYVNKMKLYCSNCNWLVDVALQT